MPKNTLTSNDQSRKIPEQLPELVGARKPNQVFKTGDNFFMNKMIGKQLILQKADFGAMYPSFPPPQIQFSKSLLCSSYECIQADRTTERKKKKGNYQCTHLHTHQPSVFLQWKFHHQKYPETGTKLELYTNNRIRAAQATIFSPRAGKRWSLTHAAGILLWHVVKKKANFTELDGKHPEGLLRISVPASLAIQLFLQFSIT